MQQVKGAVLKSRIAFIEENFGKDAVQQVLATLPPDDQRPFRLLFTSNWYPFELGKRLDDAIVRVVGQGRADFFERLGAASAEKNLSSLHAGYLTPGDPQAFLGKAPQIYSLYYETGRREYTATGPTAGTLTTYDAETFSAPDCLTVVGWYRRALELCGAKRVSVVEDECRAKGGAVCRYRVRWEP
ncbi:MAG TPA: TIGR02265 family protein [Gemmatimonadales bacterium]|nr:TIGR02265 family protein [Gemmatimonadales bacterium]